MDEFFFFFHPSIFRFRSSQGWKRFERRRHGSSFRISKSLEIVPSIRVITTFSN